MTKRRKFFRSPVEGYFMTFGDNNWAEIESEKIYGHTIPKAARDLISLATLYLTFWLPRERSAPRLDGPTKKRMTELLELAMKIRSELFPDYLWDNRSNLHKKDNIGLQLAETGHEDDFGIFLVCLNGIIELDYYILREIDNGEYGGLREGDTWNTWVTLITLILQANNLPTGVREGDPYRVPSKKERSQPAPFVRLIKHLSEFAIEGAQIHSIGALAKAIQRARRTVSFSDLDISKIDETIYGLLGVPGFVEFDPSEFSNMEFLVTLVLNFRYEGKHSISDPLRHMPGLTLGNK
jgi:hypothetical protein